MKPTNILSRVDETKAIRLSIVRSGSRWREVLHFSCSTEGCKNEWKVFKCQVKRSKRSGKCHTCAQRGKPYQSAYGALLRGARPRGIEVSISYEQFLKFVEDDACHYCKKKIERKKHAQGRHYSTSHYLDRKDNSKGYTVDNCVTCCAECNWTKGDRFTYEEFLLIAPVLQTINEMRNGEL